MGSGKTEVKPKSWIYQKQKGRPELPRVRRAGYVSDASRRRRGRDADVRRRYLAIAKRYGYDQCGILIPNCYFDSRDWDETVGAGAGTHFRGALEMRGLLLESFGEVIPTRRSIRRSPES